MTNEAPVPAKSDAEILKLLEETGALKILKEALGTDGELLMIEQDSGVVIDLTDNEICLEIEGGGESRELVFGTDQLLGHKQPALNSRVKVLSVALVEPPKETDIADLLVKHERLSKEKESENIP